MIKKRKREDLYDKFRQGAIPSGADFADFIRSQVNLLDDGLDISDDPEEPITIRAKGKEENILDFSDPINRKRWRISGRSADLEREGINIKADERTNLFIQRETGNIGIDTDHPKAKLHIKQINAPDAIRIDDEGDDTTPFVITAEGKVGVGIGKDPDRPAALLHVNNRGGVDSFRVADNRTNSTHMVINNQGDVSLGFSEPSQSATLAVNGAVSIGSNQVNPGTDGLYVKGDVKIDGNIVFADNTAGGGIQLNGMLKAKDEDVVINDNVRIKGDVSQPESKGNLFVEGDSTLGTFDNNNRLVVNGSIISGFDPEPGSSDIQEELEINEILTVNRKTGQQLVKVEGPLEVKETSKLGNNSASDRIYLNGVVERQGSEAVRIEDDLYITKDISVDDGTVRKNLAVQGATDLQNLVLQHGETINEFSRDTALSGDSNSAVPTEHAVKAYVDTLLAGSITAFGMATPPAGWLVCDGRAISRSTYARLFNLIGGEYGTGDGKTTFNLPDLRNYFIRGWHPGSGRKLGSPQDHGIAAHIHTFYGTWRAVVASGHNHSDQVSGSRRVRRGFRGHRTHPRYDSGARTSWDLHSHCYVPAGSIGHNHYYANETRPVNIVLMYCIKF